MDPVFRFALSFAVIVALALLCSTSLFSYLTALSAASPKCSGHQILLGYRSNISDFLAWPLFSCAFATLIFYVRMSRKTDDFIASNGPIVAEFASWRITYGMFLVSIATFGLVALNGFMVVESGQRYRAISHYCYSNSGSIVGAKVEMFSTT